MVTLIKKPDAEALLRMSKVSGVDMGKLLEVERIRLQQEQLRYMQTLRTGKPAGPKARHLLRSLIHSVSRSRFIQWLV